MRKLPGLAASALLALATGCPAPPEEIPEPPHALWEADVQSLNNPFPDARMLSDATGYTLRAEWYQPFLDPRALTSSVKKFLGGYTAQAAHIKGLNQFGPTLLRFSEPVDVASLPGKFARLQKSGDGYAVLEADVKFEHSRDALKGTRFENNVPVDFPEFVLVRPSIPLPDKTEGVLVMRKGVKTASGAEMGRGFAWQTSPENVAMAERAAAALGVDPSEILLALPFKSDDSAAAIKKVAAWTSTPAANPIITIPAKNDAAPDINGGTKPTGIWTSTDADWSKMDYWLDKHQWTPASDEVTTVVLGAITSRELRVNGVWSDAYVNDPATAPAIDLDFILTVPKGAKPAGGWRVVIGGHGLNGRNTLRSGLKESFCADMGNVLAKAGFACLGIDAVGHGRRGTLPEFFPVESLVSIRDNFRQTYFDLMMLSRAAQSIDFDGSPGPDLDPNLGYFGHSLGGIIGAADVSHDPRIKFSVLNVPGGGLTNILVGPDKRDQIGLLIVSESGLDFDTADYYSAFPLFRTIGQMFLDPADPVTLAMGHPGTPVLLQEGVGDLTIPNQTTEDLAAAMKVPAMTASKTDPAGVRALFRATPSRYFTPSANYNAHGIFYDAAAIRDQATTFLNSSGQSFVGE